MTRELIDTHTIRQSIKRLFSNTTYEILAELLQNSQRAQATEVTVRTSDDEADDHWLTYEDNGAGLRGDDGFFSLLALGVSDYDNPTIQDQNPMGLGIHALLAHDQVATVTFESDGRRVEIDTERWWNDRGYYQGIARRIDQGTLDRSTFRGPGLRIEVRARSVEFVSGCRESFVRGPRVRSGSYSERSMPGVAAGYGAYFTATVNGVPAPKLQIEERPLFAVQIQPGLQVFGWHVTQTDHSYVNWYGQMIPVGGLTHFRFLAVVTNGRPFEPKAPVRSGIIENDAWKQFCAAVNTLFFETIKNAAKPSYGLLSNYFSDRPSFARLLPWFLAERKKPHHSPNGEHEWDHSTVGLVCRYDDPPLLLDENVYVYDGQNDDGSHEWTTGYYGLSTFLADIGEKAITVFTHGDSDRVSQSAVYWNPGTCKDDVYEPGTWAIASISEDDPAAMTWKPVTRPVIAVTDTTSCDIEYAEFYASFTDPYDFVNELAALAWQPSDDSDSDSYDTQEYEFNESLDGWMRRRIGECLPATFSPFMAQKFMADTSSPVTTVTYEYNENKALVAIVATNLAGEQKRLKIYG